MSVTAMMLSGSVSGSTPYFLRDTMVDAGAPIVMTSHTPNTGGAYSVEPFANDATINPSGTCTRASVGLARLTNAATPPSANYTVTITLEWTVSSTGIAGLIARSSANDTNEYQVYGDPAAAKVYLQKEVSGSYTSLANYALALQGTGPHTFKLTLSGTSLTVTIDGSAQTPVTDSSIASAGKAGFFINNDGSASAKMTYLEGL